MVLREQWEAERESLHKQLQEMTKSEDTCPIVEASPKNGANATTNDRGEYELKEVYASILKIMEESDEIYRSGYSLSDLADSVGRPARIVSRAINTCHNMIFHQFLNEYRIRKVTEMMHDRSNDNLTIERIAECAGFKSRTSFIALFRKITGLTPSEYWGMVREQRAK